MVAIASNYQSFGKIPNQMIQLWIHYGGGVVKKFKEIQIMAKTLTNIPKNVELTTEITEMAIGVIQKTQNPMPTYVLMTIF